MADIDTSGGGGHGKHEGGPRAKKMSTRVDLTPMVDLAFLLISFFMLTTTLSKPKAMQLVMPKKTNDTAVLEKVAACQVMVLLVDSTDKVWCYTGGDLNTLTKVPYESKDPKKGIRQKISDKLKSVANDCAAEQPTKDGSVRKAVVLIKALKGGHYKHLVDLLDDMDITKVEIKAIQDADSLEISTVDQATRSGAFP